MVCYAIFPNNTAPTLLCVCLSLEIFMPHKTNQVKSSVLWRAVCICKYNYNNNNNNHQQQPQLLCKVKFIEFKFLNIFLWRQFLNNNCWLGFASYLWWNSKGFKKTNHTHTYTATDRQTLSKQILDVNCETHMPCDHS